MEKTNRWLESVYLVGTGSDRLLVGTLDTEAEARRLAGAVGALLGLSLRERSATDET